MPHPLPSRLSGSRQKESVVAKTTVTWLTCDQCKAETGEDVEAEESVSFGYDGYNYALDLCAPHAENFHNTVQTMIGWSSGRSRIASGRSRRAAPSSASQPEAASSRRSTPERERLRAIREWARGNGYPDLGDRGRIPRSIMAEYDAAHGA